MELFVQVILKFRMLFESKYAGEFYVLFWDVNTGISNAVLTRLRQEHVNIILVSQILGDLQSKDLRKKYTILGDGHPNYLANKLIAAYLPGKL